MGSIFELEKCPHASRVQQNYCEHIVPYLGTADPRRICHRFGMADVFWKHQASE
jgi:hypothetical protein